MIDCLFTFGPLPLCDFSLRQISSFTHGKDKYTNVNGVFHSINDPLTPVIYKHWWYISLTLVMDYRYTNNPLTSGMYFCYININNVLHSIDNISMLMTHLRLINTLIFSMGKRYININYVFHSISGSINVGYIYPINFN